MKISYPSHLSEIVYIYIDDFRKMRGIRNFHSISWFC